MLLRLAGVLSGVVGLLHVAIVLMGAPAYRYFGTGERLARLAEQRSSTPAAITLALALVFLAWSAYAFSGAGVLRRLPFLRTVLIAVGTIYTLRGLLLGPQLFWHLSGYQAVVPPRQLFFSGAALVTGLAYLAGTRESWVVLRSQR